MNIIAVCAVAVVTAVLALMLRPQSPHSAMLLSVASGIVILLSVIRNIPDTIRGVNVLLTSSGIENTDIVILFKVVGICFVTEFTCDCVTEAGLLSLSTNISFAGKILVLMTALPLFDNIIGVINTLIGV